MNTLKPLDEAIDIAGSVRELATRCDVTSHVVHGWRRMKRVPAGHVLAVEAATENRVTRYQLRPDIYPPIATQHRHQQTAAG